MALRLRAGDRGSPGTLGGVPPNRWGRYRQALGWVLIACLIVGCGGPSQPQGSSPPTDRRGSPDPAETADRRSPAGRETSGQAGGSVRRPATTNGSGGTVGRPATTNVRRPGTTNAEKPAADDDPAADGRPEPERVRLLADLLEVPDGASQWVPGLPRIEVDEARAAAAGIRKLQGERLTLYTDLQPDAEIDVLPEVFSQAFPQWCEYFSIDPADHADWRATGFLMEDKETFRRAGLVPESLPEFAHGFSWNYDLWMFEQPTAYYRRHLLLHEGTHSFMNTILRGCGPPWYMEGTAELLGTHQWLDGRLTLNVMPPTRDDVPMWGRIKMVQDAFEAGQALGLRGVIEYRPGSQFRNEPYAWCWAAAAFLDRHPRYCERFRQLGRFVLEPDFSTRFYGLIGDDWAGLADEWQVFVADLEYGYDVARMAVDDFTPGEPLAEAGTRVEVAADRGWQNSGLRLEAGVAYRVRAVGRYQVADRPQIWWCEPGGVSIRYYKGRPLGMLLAAVRPDRPEPTGPSPLIRPLAVGLGATLRPEQSGTLFLRINDSAAELDDNAGTLTAYLRAESG